MLAHDGELAHGLRLWLQAIIKGAIADALSIPNDGDISEEVEATGGIVAETLLMGRAVLKSTKLKK